jgi:hypothetical protein
VKEMDGCAMLSFERHSSPALGFEALALGAWRNGNKLLSVAMLSAGFLQQGLGVSLWRQMNQATQGEYWRSCMARVSHLVYGEEGIEDDEDDRCM